MALRVSMNVGFVTNSSSVVYHFPAEVLQDPKVKAMIEAYELGDGYVGPDMWHRGQCETIALTKDKKKEAQAALHGHGYDFEVRVPSVNAEDDSVLIIYGDEYPCLAMQLADLMKQAMGGNGGYGDDYN